MAKKTKRSYGTGDSDKPVNLKFNEDAIETGKQLAKDRYGWSLSRLVEYLILAEAKRKRGVRAPTVAA